MKRLTLSIAVVVLLSACGPHDPSLLPVAAAGRDDSPVVRPDPANFPTEDQINRNRPPGVYDLVVRGADGRLRPYVLIIRDQPLVEPPKGM